MAYTIIEKLIEAGDYTAALERLSIDPNGDPKDFPVSSKGFPMLNNIDGETLIKAAIPKLDNPKVYKAYLAFRKNHPRCDLPIEWVFTPINHTTDESGKIGWRHRDTFVELLTQLQLLTKQN